MDNLKNNIYVLGIGCGVMSVIAFYVEQKYMNSPATPIYNKSMVLYGLSHTKDAINDIELSELTELN